jgi:hypothetical protein
MRWTWTWSGQCFGYWEGDELWTHGGKHVGRRAGNDIFGPTGRYLGEVMGDSERLITNKARAAQKGVPFKPREAKASQQIQANTVALTLYKGYQDFPHPDMW